ncbi:MAG: FHA domain-containing protein [Pseudomonadota bacterium]
MKFIRDILARKAKRSKSNVKDTSGEPPVPPMDEVVATPPAASRRGTRPNLAPETSPQALAQSLRPSDDVMPRETLAPDAALDDKSRVYVWDMDENPSEQPSAPPTRQRATVPSTRGKQAAAAAAAAEGGGRPQSGRRPSRTKTRLLGFEKTESDVVGLFDGNAKSAQVGRAKFPVGWVIVIEGPGRGESFALVAGMSQIGRGEDQAVQLDFGDTAISRQNHAAVAYDPETHKFLLGHGGKSNIVRLNDKPVISTEPLSDGDTIRLGETTLRFVALCDENFNWSDENGGSEESDDVAIA